MVAHFWFVHLEKIFKQLAETQDALRVAREGSEVAEVLAVQGPENEVAVFFLRRNKAKRSEVGREFFDWDDSTRWEGIRAFFGGSIYCDRSVRLLLHQIQNLLISEEHDYALLDHVLEDEVLIVIAHLDDVRVDNVVDG